jgi:ribonuclease HI
MTLTEPPRRETMIVYTDGSVRHGNAQGGRGPAGAGVYVEGEQCFSMSQPLGVTSIMAAEAGAMLLGILMALSMGGTSITVRSDCKTLADQLAHPEWGRKNKDVAYKDLLKRLRELITPEIKVEWIPRELNRGADSLARVASKRAV